MKPLPHLYDVHLSGGASGYAQVSTAGVPELRMAPPADYDGPGDAWSPEHLLLASVQTCFLFTLRALAPLLSVGAHVRPRRSGRLSALRRGWVGAGWWLCPGPSRTD